MVHILGRWSTSRRIADRDWLNKRVWKEITCLEIHLGLPDHPIDIY